MELILSSEIPQMELITSIHILCFSVRALLLVRHNERGWDIPGGHIEHNESLEAALRRELLEEASAIATQMVPFAYLRIRTSGDKPDNYRYPYPESFIACFVGRLAELKDFSAKFETEDRRLFSPEEIRLTKWYSGNSELFELALRKIEEIGV